MLHNFLVINTGMCTLVQIKNQFIMKKILLLAAIVLGSQAFAQSAPAFLNGFAYEEREAITDDGIPFSLYVIKDDEYLRFKASILKNKKTHVSFMKSGAMCVARSVDGYEALSIRGFNFKRFYIYEE